MEFRSPRTALLAAALLSATAACAPASQPRRTVASYDDYTRKMLQLSADQNGDGRLDQWTYLDEGRPVRGEADLDGDGRIDRWEYFDAKGGLVSVGTSSREDGVEDTWTATAPTAQGETLIGRSVHRDRAIDRHEYFKGNVLIRVEIDTNADGRVDRWERYQRDVLREADFDTSFSTGRPDRRLIYDERGQFLREEADPDGDGQFTPIDAAASAPPARGVSR